MGSVFHDIADCGSMKNGGYMCLGGFFQDISTINTASAMDEAAELRDNATCVVLLPNHWLNSRLAFKATTNVLIHSVFCLNCIKSR